MIGFVFMFEVMYLEVICFWGFVLIKFKIWIVIFNFVDMVMFNYFKLNVMLFVIFIEYVVLFYLLMRNFWLFKIKIICWNNMGFKWY